MGKKSRIKMLGDAYIKRVKEITNIDIKEVYLNLEAVTEAKKAEARANTDNFSKWWIGTYPDEFNRINGEVKKNKNVPRNMGTTLKRINEWRKSLTYGGDKNGQ